MGIWSKLGVYGSNTWGNWHCLVVANKRWDISYGCLDGGQGF